MAKAPSDPEALDYARRRVVMATRELTNDHVRDVKKVFAGFIADAAVKHDADTITVLKEATRLAVAAIRTPSE